MSSPYSDEFLNAYIDDQLAADERSQLLDAVRSDSELATRLCKLQKVKDMVQLAYHNDSKLEPDANPSSDFYWHTGWAIAASLLLVLGLALGHYSVQTQERSNSLLELAQTTHLFSKPDASAQEWKLMVHINSGDPSRLQTVLDETEYLLKSSANTPRKIKVEVLTNGQGLKLLQKEGSPYAERVLALETQYQNVSFLACQIALNRYRDEDGFDIDLLPGVKIVPSAIQQALTRQREGWTYLRI